MKSLRFLSFLVIVAAWFGVAPSAQAADGAEGKFHLVYLVSAVELKPGAKVFVDPVFFSDGQQIKSFYDYCSMRRKENWGPRSDLKSAQIAEDLEALHRYCDKEPITFPGEKYHLLNNEGVSLRLGTVTLSFPHPGESTIKVVAGEPALLKLDQESDARPRHFFLMSKNKVLLDKLIPVKNHFLVDASPLTERARRYAEETKGKAGASGWLVPANGPARGPSPGFQDAKPFIVGVLVADMDGDGKDDILTGMTAEQTDSERPFHWAGIGFLFSKLGNAFLADVQQPSNYGLDVRQGYISFNPLALINIRNCSYALAFSSEPEPTYRLIGLVPESESCPHSYFQKAYFRPGNE